jgi:hypothetical protein
MMNEPTTTPWQGDWQARLRNALRRVGFDTLESFLAANPGKTYFALVKLLNADIAPMQLYGEQLRAARSSNCLREAAMDCLVRFLSYYLKRGWGNGRHFQSRSASAYAAWRTTILQFVQDECDLTDSLDTVWNMLEMSNPPHGWIPKDTNDSLIQDAFAKGWPIKGAN